LAPAPQPTPAGTAGKGPSRSCGRGATQLATASSSATHSSPAPWCSMTSHRAPLRRHPGHAGAGLFVSICALAGGTGVGRWRRGSEPGLVLVGVPLPGRSGHSHAVGDTKIQPVTSPQKIVSSSDPLSLCGQERCAQRGVRGTASGLARGPVRIWFDRAAYRRRLNFSRRWVAAHSGRVSECHRRLDFDRRRVSGHPRRQHFSRHRVADIPAGVSRHPRRVSECPRRV